MVVENSQGEVGLVIFFPGSTEIRWSKSPPRRGQRVQDQRGDVSFVTEVVRTGLNTYTVTCVGSRAFLEDLRSRSSRELVSDLLWAARRTFRSREDVSHHATWRRSRRLDRRDDWFSKYLEIGYENRRLLDLERGDESIDSSG